MCAAPPGPGPNARCRNELIPAAYVVGFDSGQDHQFEELTRYTFNWAATRSRRLSV